MISVSEAEKIIRENMPAPKSQELATDLARGLVLAENVKSPCPSPRFSNSAMDGFAVIWHDVKNATENNPVALKVVGESQAGISFPGIPKSGEAVRINTGARIPDGADSVIPIEHCVDHRSTIEIFKVERYNQYIRFKGEEFEADSRILEKGTCLDARHMALLASLGITKVSVYKKPLVSILVTGTELVDFREHTKESQLHDTNSPMLSSLVTESGAKTASIKRVADDIDETVQSIGNAAKKSDLIIVSGGVSVGPHDHVKEAAKACGFKELFWQVNQKPGKPLFFAKKNRMLLFGLPGNPVSAYMGFFHYIQPLLAVMGGLTGRRNKITIPLRQDFFVKGGRTQFLRVAIKDGSAQVLKRQDSHMLTTVSEADGYIIADGNTELEKDVEVEVFLFPPRRP